MTVKDFKKTNTRILIAFLINLILFIGIITMIIHSKYVDHTLYTMHGTVIEINTDARTTAFIDNNGECWRFKGIKDWQVGDKITCTIHSNNTSPIFDDKVIGAWKN